MTKRFGSSRPRTATFDSFHAAGTNADAIFVFDSLGRVMEEGQNY
jgi:hypothetical protein